LLYVGFCLFTSVFFRFAASAKEALRIPFCLVAAALSLAAGVIPPLFETYRYFNGESVVLYALSLAYTALSFALFFVKNTKIQNLD